MRGRQRSAPVSLLAEIEGKPRGPPLSPAASALWYARISPRLRPSGEGTAVTESYEIVVFPPRPVMAIRRLLPHYLDMRPHIRRTLHALKQTAENDARCRPGLPS